MQFEPEPEDEWQAHCRNAVAMVEGETAPEEPVMAGEVVRVEAEAESEPVVAGEVVPEIVEGEEGVVAEPVVASETMARDAPAEGAAEEPRGWLSSLLGARREGGAEADAEASKPEIEQAAGEAVPEVMERGAPAEGSTRGSIEATGKGKNRPPSPAPADLVDLGLMSTDDISGDYRTGCYSCFGSCYDMMIVVPLGADMIEVRKSYCFFLPPLCLGPYVDGDVWIRKRGSNSFHRWGASSFLGDSVKFEAEETNPYNGRNIRGSPVKQVWVREACNQSIPFWKVRASQKRTFQKVDTGDLAGTWCSCMFNPFVPCWVCTSGCLCTTKKALNQDQYEESGCGLSLPLPLPLLPRRDDPGRAGPYTRTRVYVNGHPTNGFYTGIFTPPDHQLNFIRWYSDASYGSGGMGVFSKKLW